MKVSVYCFVYNHEKYLRDALEGFVNQNTDFEYEVIVHDDASTDKSADIIKEYEKKYPQIIKPIYQKENQYSKNVDIFKTFILPRMTGEYVAACEGDDYWTDCEKLKRQIDFLDNHREYSACVHNTMMLNYFNKTENIMYPQIGDHDITIADLLVNGGYSYHTSSVVYRIQYAKKRPDFFNKAKGYGDYPLAIYLGFSGKVRFLDYVMSTYRYGSENSWTVRMKKVTTDNQYEGVVASKIEMLKAANEFSDYHYQNIINDAISRHQYTLLEIKEDYKSMRKGIYRKYYLEESLSRKMKLYFKSLFPGLYRFIVKQMNK